MGWKQTWRKLTYARNPFTIWICAALVCLTVGVFFDVLALILPGWGSGDSSTLRVQVGLWSICRDYKENGAVIFSNCTSTIGFRDGKLASEIFSCLMLQIIKHIVVCVHQHCHRIQTASHVMKQLNEII